MAIVYRGARVGIGGGEVAITRQEDGGVAQPFRQSVVWHSPAGFEWGYGGSGPADLALNLLVDALGEDPAAVERYFRGGGDPESTWAPRSVPLHQAFKAQHIAPLPRNEPWSITQEAIVRWVEQYRDRR